MKSIKPPEKATLNVNPITLPTMTCTNCGNFTFEEVVVIKRVSKLISPNGKDSLVPIPVFSCVSCGATLPVGNDNYVNDLVGDVLPKSNGGVPTSPTIDAQPESKIILS